MIYTIAYVKIQKIKIDNPIYQTYSPTVFLKVDFEKADKHTGGKWLIHDTKRKRTISYKAWNFPAQYFRIFLSLLYKARACSFLCGMFTRHPNLRLYCLFCTRWTYITPFQAKTAFTYL